MTNEELVRQIKSGINVTANMEYLYTRNKTLISKMVEPFADKEEKEDLMQEAYFGLIKAVERYEDDKNVKFMTYAKWWIRQAVMMYIENNSNLIVVPSYVRQKQREYAKAVGEYRNKYGKEPDINSIADIMRISVKEVENIKASFINTISIDKQIGEDENCTLSDVLEDDFRLEEETHDKIMEEDKKGTLWSIVDTYTDERESDVIKSVYINQKNYSDIGKDYGISAQRVEQIKRSGIRKLRSGKVKRILRERYEIAKCSIYRTSFGKFAEHGESTVEYIARKRLEIEELKKQLFG